MPHLLSNPVHPSISQISSINLILTIPPSHSCIEALKELLPHPSHIQEGTLPQATCTWYTDGSSFLHEGGLKSKLCPGIRYRGVGGTVLPAHTTNQQAELIAFTCAFQLTQG